jgi:hypothetical protein
MATDFEKKYNVRYYSGGTELYSGSHARDQIDAVFTVDGKQYRVHTFTTNLAKAQAKVKLVFKQDFADVINIGRPKGSKNYAGRQYNEKDLKRLFNNIHAAVVGAAISTKATTLRGIATDMLLKEVENAEFDDYTGNLTASFAAHVVQNRKIVTTIPFPKLVKGFRYGRIRRTKRGARFTKRRTPKYHKPGARRSRTLFVINERNHKTHKKEDFDIRFLRKWENDSGGYESRKSPKQWSGNIRSGVLITNSAPYSSAVDRIPGRRVLKNAVAANAIRGKWSKKAQMLGRFAAKSIIEDTFGKKLR